MWLYRQQIISRGNAAPPGETLTQVSCPAVYLAS